MQTLSQPSAKQETAVVNPACGFHLLLTLRDCKADILNDQKGLEELTQAAAVASGATVMRVCSQQFSPQGVTAIAILAESHASLHTYPEFNTVFWDCFTCGTECQPELSIPVLVEALKPEIISKEIIYRH